MAIALLITLILILAGIIVAQKRRISRTDQRLSADLKGAEAKVAAAQRAKSELLSNMSHELRTPLNAIIGFAQMTREEMMGPLGSPKYREYAAIIEEAGQRLLSIISDILDIAAIEAGDPLLCNDLVDIPSALESVVRIVQGWAETAKVTIAIAPLSPNLPLLRGEGRRVKQMLLNLVINGVKFTPAGGKVTVAGQRNSDGGISLLVTDTGIGIAADKLELILAPFALGEDVHSRRYQGHGLGLTIARELVSMHGGQLSIASTLDKGTCVTMTFPPSCCVPAGQLPID